MYYYGIYITHLDLVSTTITHNLNHFHLYLIFLLFLTVSFLSYALEVTLIFIDRSFPIQYSVPFHVGILLYL